MLNGKEGRLLRRNNDKDTRMKINILLCDDDKDFLQRISDAVAGQPVPPGASICITKSSNPAEITDRQLSQYHIMFLDIDMDERSGMDIARRVRELHLDTVIVFVTNYPEFSMEGYEVRAFRYLLKQELEQKLANYFRDALAELPRDDKVLRFSASAESFNIPYKDILYLESNQRVIYLYTVKPMQVPDRFYGKMEDLAAELEGDGFLRIQKSYLVNMAYIKKFNYDRVILLDGKELSVSQKRYSQMKVQYLSWKNKNWGNLKTYRDQWLAQKHRMGSAWQTCMDGKWESYRESLQKLRGKNFIVINDFGWPISPDHYGKIVDRVAEKAGIRKIHPHMFRHTFVSILLSNPDIGVATVAAEAGHAQPSTTLAIYTQVYHKRQDSIRSQMSETLYKRKTPER